MNGHVIRTANYVFKPQQSIGHDRTCIKVHLRKLGEFSIQLRQYKCVHTAGNFKCRWNKYNLDSWGYTQSDYAPEILNRRYALYPLMQSCSK